MQALHCLHSYQVQTRFKTRFFGELIQNSSKLSSKFFPKLTKLQIY